MSVKISETAGSFVLQFKGQGKVQGFQKGITTSPFEDMDPRNYKPPKIYNKKMLLLQKIKTKIKYF